MTLVNRAYLKEQNTDYILFKTFLISVWDVRQANSSIKVAIFHLNFKAQLNGKSVVAKIKIEAHIINNLKINLLLGIDNLAPQEIVIDLSK